MPKGVDTVSLCSYIGSLKILSEMSGDVGAIVPPITASLYRHP